MKRNDDGLIELVMQPSILGALFGLLIILLYFMGFLSWISLIGGILIIAGLGSTTFSGIYGMAGGFIGFALVFIDYVMLYAQVA